MNFVQGISKSVCWNADHSWHDTTWILTLMGWFKKWGSLVHESKSSSSASVTANTNNYMYGHWPSAAFPLGLNDLPQGTLGIQEGHIGIFGHFTGSLRIHLQLPLWHIKDQMQYIIYQLIRLQKRWIFRSMDFFIVHKLQKLWKLLRNSVNHLAKWLDENCLPVTIVL